jgi:hypothetical protein
LEATEDGAAFEAMLTGGHPDSLGRTVEVVDLVHADRSRLEDLYDCYSSDDEVVRLRVSSAMKRVCLAEPDLLVPYLDRLLGEVSRIDQASAKWTLAQLFLMLGDRMSDSQRNRAEQVMKANLEDCDDWIVQNRTMETLGEWAADDPALAAWLSPRLREREGSHLKSVAKKAAKTLDALTGS